MIDVNYLQSFLSEITSIRKLHEKISEINGDNFNIFKILRLSTNEVRTHSAFLGEILNPKGTHGFKERFLQEFVEILNIKDFDCASATIQIEMYIGQINEDRTEGGNIDILLYDKKRNLIIIENKIYAGDQENQLLRYNNYGKKWTSLSLLYLTSDGKDPSENSIKGLTKEDFRCISYSTDIINWLTRCREIAIDKGVLRETIGQYIYLLKLLTGQINSSKMNDEIISKIIKDEDNLRTFFELHKNNVMESLRRKLVDDLLRKQLEDIANNFEPKLDFSFNDNIGIVKDTEFHFIPPKNLSIEYYLGFGFCKEPYSFLVYGIFSDNQPYNEKHKDHAIHSLGKGLGWSNWLWIDKFEDDLVDWSVNPEPWLGILDNKTMKDNIFEKVTRLMNVCLKLNQ